jgi:glycosyltransferase involved in cell wall biosynthesis
MNNSVPDKSIRICFVSLKAYPLFNSSVEAIFGGAEVDLYLLATELAKDKNFEVSFVVGDYGQDRVEIRENVTLIKSANVSKNLFLGSPKIFSALKKADADIYMDEACSLGTALYAFFCKKYGRKFVYRTAHTRECDGTYLHRHAFRGKAVLWAFRNAHRLLVQNEIDAENLLRTTQLSSIVIRGAARLPAIRHQDRNTILWVARSAGVKQPELFFKLAKEIPGEHFTMICPKATGDDRYDELAAKAETIENLEFIRGVPYHELDSFFECARVFVNTSESEGFPNTYIQACKCAIPILSLKVNPDGFLDKHQCGMCAKNDWNRFIEMLNKLLEPETNNFYGGNGRRYVEETHDISKIAEKYKDIFRDLVSS